MKVIAYSIIGKNENSNEYYKKVADFTDIVLDKAGTFAKDTIDCFSQYIESSRNIRCGYNEHILEYLILGVFWNVYKKQINHKKLNIFATNIPTIWVTAR